ncbi:g5774 [Coccomyxa viridis]|uniref:G5774 protein n=1 Tax=Coccomyxa viridis TaxID=1274662 RepID=A0ABP1FV08_9CHLO
MSLGLAELDRKPSDGAERPEKRGPKLGDAASLWNFTPSPGWTKEEAAILKLCLMKYGVGKWVQILETGLLPGKLIQQLNGQAQRLLGQQSLAGCTGLLVDIDRIREDNEHRTDVERKAGLIIWSGPNPTRAMKEEWNRETKAAYGLTAEQLAEVDAQLEEVAASKALTAGPSNARVPLADLMEVPLDALSREQKILLLKRLRSKLCSLVAALTAKQSGAPITRVHGTPVKDMSAAPERLACDGGAAQPLPMAPLDPALTVAQQRMNTQGANKRRRGPAIKQKAAAPKQRPKAKRSKKRAADGADDSGALAEAELTALEADMSQLQGMGFSKTKAKEALEECHYRLDMAVEWLVSHCV